MPVNRHVTEFKYPMGFLHLTTVMLEVDLQYAKEMSLADHKTRNSRGEALDRCSKYYISDDRGLHCAVTGSNVARWIVKRSADPPAAT